MIFRPGKTPTPISNYPKVKRKRHQGKQKYKNRSVCPGLGKAYRTLRGNIFYQWFQLGRFGFPCVRKQKKMAKREQQLTKWDPNPSKMKPRGALWGAGESRRRPDGREPTNLPPTGSFSVPVIPKWAPFWALLDLQGCQNGATSC